MNTPINILQKLVPISGKTYVNIPFGINQNIIDAIHKLLPKATAQVQPIAAQFKGSSIKQTAENIFNFIKKNINYKVDSDENQIIQLPSMLLKTRQGDCKSYSLFTGAILNALNIPFAFRYTNYSTGTTPRHVYVVAYSGNGEEIIIDAVYNKFNAEKQYNYKKDYKMNNTSINGFDNKRGIGIDPLTIATILSITAGASKDAGGIFDTITSWFGGGGGNSKGQAAADKRKQLYNQFLQAIEPVGKAMLRRGGWQAAYTGGTSAQDPSWYAAFMNGDFDSSGASGAIQSWIGQTLQSPEFAQRGNRNWEKDLQAMAPKSGLLSGSNLVVYGGLAAAALIVFLIVKKKK
jgi:hypothetical protein